MKKVKYKKIRGQKKRLRDIQTWIENNKTLDLDYLTEYHRDYVKFWVNPFSRLNLTNSRYMKPSGIYFESMVLGLIEIYQHWKQSLDRLNEPYYLKIWLFQHEPERSQIVCAIRDSLHFYNNTFEIAENPQFIFDNFELTPILSEKLMTFKWQHTLENDYIFEDYLADPSYYDSLKDYETDKTWFKNKKKTAKKIEFPKESNYINDYCYVVPKRSVWLGEIK